MNDRLRDMAFADAEVVQTASENVYVPALERYEAFPKCLTQSGILRLASQIQGRNIVKHL